MDCLVTLLFLYDNTPLSNQKYFGTIDFHSLLVNNKHLNLVASGHITCFRLTVYCNYAFQKQNKLCFYHECAHSATFSMQIEHAQPKLVS